MLVKNFKLQNACALKYNNYYTLFHVYSLHQFLKYLEYHTLVACKVLMTLLEVLLVVVKEAK